MCSHSWWNDMISLHFLHYLCSHISVLNGTSWTKNDWELTVVSFRCIHAPFIEVSVVYSLSWQATRQCLCTEVPHWVCWSGLISNHPLLHLTHSWIQTGLSANLILPASDQRGSSLPGSVPHSDPSQPNVDLTGGRMLHNAQGDDRVWGPGMMLMTSADGTPKDPAVSKLAPETKEWAVSPLLAAIATIFKSKGANHK